MHEVVFSPEAEDDLKALVEHISLDAPSASLTFPESIRRYCEGFDLFPQRGTDRSDIRPNPRTIGFDRRVTIAFEIEAPRVTILRILHGGRNIDVARRDDPGGSPP